MLKLYATYRNLLQQAAQIELIVRHVASVDVRRCRCRVCVNDAVFIVLDYNVAVRQGTASGA